jgi:hypothetical protein
MASAQSHPLKTGACSFFVKVHPQAAKFDRFFVENIAISKRPFCIE